MKFFLDFKTLPATSFKLIFDIILFFLRHRPKTVLVHFLGKFFFISNIPRPHMCSCGLICSSVIAFTGVFYSIFRKKTFSLVTSAYISIEKRNPKKIFCIINLVHSQVYRVEKVGKYLLPQSKKSSFYFSDIFLKSDILTQVLGFFGTGITLNILENNIFQQHLILRYSSIFTIIV